MVAVLITQLCPTLCNPMDYSWPGSSVHGILQARILEWVAIPFSRPRDRTQVSHIAGRFFTIWSGSPYTHTHTHTLRHSLFFRLFSHIGHCRVFSRVPCTLQKVLITCKYLFLKKKMDGYFPVHSCTHSCMHSFIQKVLTEGVIHIGQ